MSCSVCQKNDSINFDELNLVYCENCGHVEQKDIEKFNYDDLYIYNAYRFAPVLQMSWLRLGMINSVISSTGKLLDIGCGQGDFVRQANYAGFDAYGFDVIRDNNVRSANFGDYYYNIVTLFDSLEHAHDLKKIFSAKTKYFVVSLPIFDQTNHKTDIKKLDTIRAWKHYKPNEHLHYFSDSSIFALFQNNGYKFIKKLFTENLIRNDIVTYFFEEAADD